MTAFFDIDLENVAQVVEGRAGETQHFLLLDGGGFGVALRDDDAPENGTIFSGDVLPGGLAFVDAKIDLAFFVTRLEKDAPAVFGHLDIIELRPAIGFATAEWSEIIFQTLSQLNFTGAPVP